MFFHCENTKPMPGNDRVLRFIKWCIVTVQYFQLQAFHVKTTCSLNALVSLGSVACVCSVLANNVIVSFIAYVLTSLLLLLLNFAPYFSKVPYREQNELVQLSGQYCIKSGSSHIKQGKKRHKHDAEKLMPVYTKSSCAVYTLL
uniref:Uncharacterized protein n=1 Tax=Glossina pallidipes TaxID=7398 RepID=A0A1A9ZGR1_GLOPL